MTKSQEDQILDALLAGRKLTPIDALNEFGCMRLGGRVYDLKKRGFDIRTEDFKTPSGKHVARYWMPSSLMCKGNGHHNWSLKKESCECGELTSGEEPFDLPFPSQPRLIR